MPKILDEKVKILHIKSRKEGLYMASNLNKQEIPTVRQAEIKTGLVYEDMSPLGKKLHDIAKEIELSDEPGCDEDAIRDELRKRRGGHSHDDENSHFS